ncbi:MAG: nitroreductase family protein [Alistipes sp.]|nr:nitroreductase family protein [Alistipes sp.]
MKQILITVLLCATALVGLRWGLESKQESGAIETIMSRRSIRAYKEIPVEREKLDQIALCGIAAPNAMNKQAWAVRIVDSKEWIDNCTAAFLPTIEGTPWAERLLTPDFRNMFRNAAAVIFVAAESGTYAGVDCGLMGENMMLAAHELGLGTCCLGSPVPFLNSEQGAPFLASLNLPEGYALQYAIAVGYPDQEPEAKPRNAEVIEYVE